MKRLDTNAARPDATAHLRNDRRHLRLLLRRDAILDQLSQRLFVGGCIRRQPQSRARVVRCRQRGALRKRVAPERADELRKILEILLLVRENPAARRVEINARTTTSTNCPACCGLAVMMEELISSAFMVEEANRPASYSITSSAVACSVAAR